MDNNCYIYYHCKKYLVKMTTIAGHCMQFQGPLNRLVWLKEFPNTIIHQPLTISSVFKELAQTFVSKPTYISSKAIIQFRTR